MLGDSKNLERVYRASRGEANQADMHFLSEMRTMISRAAQLVKGVPVLEHRVSKLLAGMELFMQLGASRNLIFEARDALAAYQEGRLSEEVVREKIQTARTRKDKLQQFAQQTAQQHEGIIAVEWFENWVLNRTFSNPLDSFEKELAATETALSRPETKPDHVVDTDL